MKYAFQVIVSIAVCFLLIACGQSNIVISSPNPSPVATETATNIPKLNVLSTLNAIPTSTEGYISPTLLPTIDPALIPALLSKAFSIQTLQGVNEQNMLKITGWDYGFRSYDWLDSKHLLLNVSIGEESNAIWGTESKGQWAVLNLETAKIWLPPISKSEVGHYIPWDKSPRWSSKLGWLIAFTEKFVDIYTPDGDRVAHYEGNMLGISPSATKILTTDNRLIDLSTGTIINFDWHFTDLENGEPSYLYQPSWSSDENQVYRCCYHFGELSSGKGYSFTYSDLGSRGRKMPEYYLHSTGEWVLNNSRLLVQWDYINFSSPGFIPLFDPIAKTYYDLNELANIPAEKDGYPFCEETSASPDGLFVWVECYTANYLVDLNSFQSTKYPGNPQDVLWSSDSRFGWMYSPEDENHLQVLSVLSKELKPLAVDPLLATPEWHPTDDVLAYISEDGQRLELLNAKTMSKQELALPAAFRTLVWDPSGRYIALVAEDDSLWQVDYPNLENVEQLALSLPEVRNVNWSPDGNSLAFVSGADIYVVDVVK